MPLPLRLMGVTLFMARPFAISSRKGPDDLAVIDGVPARQLVNGVDQARRHLGASTTHNYAPTLGVGL